MAKAKKARTASAGLALMKANEGVTGCGVGGKEYLVDADGYIEVPHEYVDVLLSHGFNRVEAEADEAPPTE